MRLEGIRRGGLVSQLATAARNVTSAGIRAPLDTLGNVMDTALYNAGEATGAAGKTAAFTGSLISLIGGATSVTCVICLDQKAGLILKTT